MLKPYLIFFSSCLLMASCTPQKSDEQTTTSTEQADDGIRRLPDYAYRDSLMQGSHKVVYSIESTNADDLPVVVDEDGAKYSDKRFTLDITKDGKQLFHNKFTKADFKSQLPDEFKKLGIMDGIRFHHAQEGKLYFNTCVSFPESDMSCPFLLIIGPDGSYRIEPDTSLDEDELPPPPAEAQDVTEDDAI